MALTIANLCFQLDFTSITEEVFDASLYLELVHDRLLGSPKMNLDEDTLLEYAQIVSSQRLEAPANISTLTICPSISRKFGTSTMKAG